MDNFFGTRNNENWTIKTGRMEYILQNFGFGISNLRQADVLKPIGNEIWK